MNNFEFTDPNETLGAQPRRGGLSLEHAARCGRSPSLWTAIQDLPRHLGQHSGGMVVCQGELDAVVPLEPASMPGRVVIQWDKDDCADMGIVKVDLLGLGMMAVLQDAIELVNTGGPQPCGTGWGRSEPRRQRAQPLSISRTCRRTIPPSTSCCRRPTPSASSRWSRARRWRRCRG